MELINCVKSALESQCDIVVDYRNREFITDCLHWSRTIEGYLFWEILYISYINYGIYDYITIIYIYITDLERMLLNVVLCIWKIYIIIILTELH